MVPPRGLSGGSNTYKNACRVASLEAPSRRIYFKDLELPSQCTQMPAVVGIVIQPIAFVVRVPATNLTLTRIIRNNPEHPHHVTFPVRLEAKWVKYPSFRSPFSFCRWVLESRCGNTYLPACSYQLLDIVSVLTEQLALRAVLGRFLRRNIFEKYLSKIFADRYFSAARFGKYGKRLTSYGSEIFEGARG